MRRAFTYRVPVNLQKLGAGQRVLVPFGRVRKTGFYLGPAPTPPADVDVKDIQRALDDHSFIPSDLFSLCMWMADYYFANPADCLAAALPPALKGPAAVTYEWGDSIPNGLPNDIIRLARPGVRLSPKVIGNIRKFDTTHLRQLVDEGRVIERWPETAYAPRPQLVGYSLVPGSDLTAIFNAEIAESRKFEGVKTRRELSKLEWSEHYIRKAIKSSLLSPVYSEEAGEILNFVKPRPDVASISLNTEQSSAVGAVTSALNSGLKVFLLHGITGSGKTLVYCHLARAVLDLNRTVLVLTPEISLTGPTLAYFRGFFGDMVTVVHSAMSERERFESWNGIKKGKYRLVIGPRSALFAPLPDLGLIVVDEEHDGSYKQDEPSPRFHGRDSAIMRASICKVPVLLGSATPSLESYYSAKSGKYHLLELMNRPGDARLPVVRVVDMRTERVGGDLPFVSFVLKKETEIRLANKEQVILYLNRRGYAPQLKCGDCGHVPQCPHCQVRLTYHKVGARLTCHYCDYSTSSYHICEKCQGLDFLLQGAGTQRVEESIPRLFTGARVVRLDSDSASGRHGAYRILSDFAARKFNLLLGTQMVTKGLDLPGVSLVGVLSADAGADLPDFRAPEKTFARLVQVAGRSGRGEHSGEVLIQTFSPESDLIADAARQDYHSFYNREVESRQACLYPPFTRLINFVFSGENETKLEAAAAQFRSNLQLRLNSAKLDARILGPAPCALYRLRGRYRRHLFVKTSQTVRLVRALTAWELEESHFSLPGTIRIAVDVDPDDMM
jgi:primosomal protein N' (replication factor Y)